MTRSIQTTAKKGHDVRSWSLTVIATLEEFNDMNSMEVLLWHNEFEGCDWRAANDWRSADSSVEAGGDGGNGLPGHGFLVRDSNEDCTDPWDWSVSVDNLQNGLYRVTLYPQREEFGVDIATGAMLVNGVAVASMDGAVGASSGFAQGSTYDVVDVSVTSGTLFVAGVRTTGGASTCAALAGMQIEFLSPAAPVVPALDPKAMVFMGWAYSA